MEPLVNYKKIMLGDKTITDIEKDLNDYIKEHPDKTKKDAAIELLLPQVMGGITLKVPTGSGIVSDVADIAGEYTGEVKVTFGDDAPIGA